MPYKYKVKRVNGVGRGAVINANSESEFNTILDNPYADLSKVRFHSDLHYPSVVNTVSGSVALPQVNRWVNSGNLIDQGHRYNTYQLFAHGQSGHPWVMGRILNYPSSGNEVALEGSVPIQMDTLGFARWLTLGADSAHVLLHEQAVASEFVDIPAITISYVINVSDLTVENYSGNAPGGPVLKLEKTRTQMGMGKFDSDKNYIKSASQATKDTDLVGGTTLRTGLGNVTIGGVPATRLAYTYSSEGYTVSKQTEYVPTGNVSVEQLSFTADSDPVKF